MRWWMLGVLGWMGCARERQILPADSDPEVVDSEVPQETADTEDPVDSEIEETGEDTSNSQVLTIRAFTSMRAHYDRLDDLWNANPQVRDAARLQDGWLTFEIPPQNLSILQAWLEPSASEDYAYDLQPIVGMSEWAETGYAFPPVDGQGRTFAMVRGPELVAAGDAFTVGVRTPEQDVVLGEDTIEHVFAAPPWPLRLGQPDAMEDWTGQTVDVDPALGLRVELEHPLGVDGQPESVHRYILQVIPRVGGQNQFQGSIPVESMVVPVNNQVTIDLPSSAFATTVNVNGQNQAVDGYQIDACLMDESVDNAGAILQLTVQ